MPSLILVWFLILLTASTISISTVFDTFGLFYFRFIIFCIFFFFQVDLLVVEEKKSTYLNMTKMTLLTCIMELHHMVIYRHIF